MIERVRVGFVGLGGIARQRHVPGLRAIDGVEMVAVANSTRKSSERAAADFGIPQVCDSWEEVVARDDVDAVLIGTWPYLHHDVSIAALDAGKHVFTQARMAMDAAEARAMVAKAQSTGRVAMVCPVPIGLSVDRVIARLLRERTLGDLRLVRVQSFSDAYASADAPMNWRKDHRLSGMNMHTLGMYIEVIHRWFGWTRTVSAMTDIFVPERADGRGAMAPVRIPDQILVNSRLRNGLCVQYVVNAAVHHGGDAIEVYGSAGTLRYDVPSDKLWAAAPGGEFEVITPDESEAYDLKHWRVEREFVQAIREAGEVHPNFQDGLRYMEVLQAVYDSASKRTEIEVGFEA